MAPERRDDKGGGLKRGLGLRDAALDQIEAENPVALLKARRAFAAALIDQGEATADDVRSVVELPALANPNLMGALARPFSGPGWVSAGGLKRSKRPEARGHWLTRWVLEDAAGLKAWLARNPMPRGVKQ